MQKKAASSSPRRPVSSWVSSHCLAWIFWGPGHWLVKSVRCHSLVLRRCDPYENHTWPRGMIPEGKSGVATRRNRNWCGTDTDDRWWHLPSKLPGGWPWHSLSLLWSQALRLLPERNWISWVQIPRLPLCNCGPWASSLAHFCLSFFICKVGTGIVLVHRGVTRTKWANNAFKGFISGSGTYQTFNLEKYFHFQCIYLEYIPGSGIAWPKVQLCLLV